MPLIAALHAVHSRHRLFSLTLQPPHSHAAMEPLIAVIKQAWGWVGIKPAQVIGDNSFGNLLIKDETGRYWRLCPEDLCCTVVASSREELDALSQSQEFRTDWHMANLVAAARERLGALRPGYKYCLRIPGVLGGQYGGANLAVMPFHELLTASGHLGREIRDLPDGAQIRLHVTD